MRATTMVCILAALVLCSGGCGGRQAQGELARLEAANQVLAANKTLVRRAHEEVWNNGNLAVVDELYSPEFLGHWASGDDCGREGLKKAVTEARTAFPDINEEILHIVAEGDLVVTHFISSGTLVGEAAGSPVAGRKISRPEIAVHRIAGGMIVEQWTVSDQLTLMKQLGMM